MSKQESLFTSTRQGLFSEYYLAQRLPQQSLWQRDGLADLHTQLLAIYKAYEATLVPKNEENSGTGTGPRQSRIASV